MKNIKFMKNHKIVLIVSMLTIALSIFSFFSLNFEYGIDFRGGVVAELDFNQSVKSDEVKDILINEHGNITIYTSGKSSVLTIETDSKEHFQNILSTIKTSGQWSNVDILKNEFIGPKVGEELKINGLLALVLVIVSVLIYTSVRFEFKFAVGAIFALVHDIIITMGMVSLFKIQVDLTVLAALLALLGYSLNDTIVVYDRIRENFQKLSDKNVYDIINISLNETLSRTLMTSLTTASTLVALLLFGGSSLSSFSIVLLFGIVIGTYSSIYIASNLLLIFNVDKEQFEKEDIDRENGVL
tara:strand:+ start:144003 stop:144899 length:897 start_codon:yes stop_codon:yes gene_type:complete